jgi:hypothetical protein
VNSTSVVIEAILLQRARISLTLQSISAITRRRTGLLVFLELVGDKQRHVRHVVQQVQEERPVLILADELHRPLGVPRRKLRLVGVGFDDVLAVNQRQRRIRSGGWMIGPHVVRVRQAEVAVEAMPRRQEPRVVAQVPLAKNRGRVAALSQNLRQQHFVFVDPTFALGRRPDAHPLR